MPDRRLRAAASLCALASLVTLAAPARAELIAGWDFSQYASSGFLSLDGVTFTATLPANYSDFDPTFNAGAESAEFGAMYMDGSFGSTDISGVLGTFAEPFQPLDGSLVGNADAPFPIPFDAHSVLTSEGQTFANFLSFGAFQTGSLVFEADLGSVAQTRGNWSVSFGGQTLSGTATVDVEFSTDGASYQSFGSVMLTTVDTAFDVALGTATSSTAYVRLTLNTANAFDIPYIDNVAIEAPEAGSGAASALALVTLGLLRSRRARTSSIG